MRNAMLVFLVSCLMGPALGQFADYAYVAPTTKAALPASGLDPDLLAGYLARVFPKHVFQHPGGGNAQLKADAEVACGARVASGYPLGLDAYEIFGPAFDDDGCIAFLAGIASADALALRLRVDLSGLVAGEELWVIDPTGPRAFGSFGAEDAIDGGRWLPTTEGDSVVLLLRSAHGQLPPLYLDGLSHFFVGIGGASGGLGVSKQIPCPIPVGYDTNAVFQEVATAVAMLFVADANYGQVQCTGTLLNNPDTAALEPLMISAHHCFDGDVDPRQVDAIWDYRLGEDGSTPVLANLPRSRGQSILAEDERLDAELIMLDDAPVGTWGRAWLGWDTRSPAVGDRVQGVHHPSGTTLKIAYGEVQETNVDACLDALCFQLGYDQTQVQWDYGITEGGSSGSPALFRDLNYRLFGMLSNGPVHNCDTPEENFDNFASFQVFFDQIGCYLGTEYTCGSPTSDDLCAAEKSFGEDSPAVIALRAFRDKLLMPTAAGRTIVSAYYGATPRLAATVQKSTAARQVFVTAATPFAVIGAWLERVNATF